MKTILYVSSKEKIELSCPDYIWPVMRIIWRYLRVKTVKLHNNSQIKTVILDEFADFKKEKND